MSRRASSTGMKQQQNEERSKSQRCRAAIKEHTLFYEKKLALCAAAWSNGRGAVAALVDAVICCHEGRIPIPLWVAQGTCTLIKRLVMTGAMQGKRGRGSRLLTRYIVDLKDYARWELVRELEDRRHEITAQAKTLSRREKDRCPEYAALAEDDSLDQLFAAAAEHLQQSKHPAQGSAETIERSYKKVRMNMRRGNAGLYYLPGYQNPLHPRFIIKGL